ncbi:M23 family metallopeptidase [Desulforamulus aeronauticus]|uniref:Peptidase family M23 n=1 Tax=Desulforamulus aeronauticus DSM 10349 TaxID=1121421 RepID=A0A1M6TV87_9FIRM|nr:M23 family metallopeptidase [Desulforamulus aeronauticus]SHK60708.1 Peptidase family M23 [Desulforamulus aeronauticus DSM 10349]
MKIGRFSFDRFKKKSKDPLSHYYGSNYGSNDDWTSRYQSDSYWRRRKPQGKGLKTFYRMVVALGILAVLLVLKESPHPWSQQARDGLKVALNTEWNVTPALDKVVQIGLQTINMDWALFNELSNPTLPAMTTPDDSWAIPVSGQVVQEFGWTKSPEDNLERFNPGIDIGAAAGSGVKAVQSGKVSRIGHDRTYGEFVLIEHRKGEYALYAGLTEIAVIEGHQIQAGEIIGKIAEQSTGDPVLHFEVRENDKLIDPLKKIKDTTVITDPVEKTDLEKNKNESKTDKADNAVTQTKEQP